MPDTHYLAIDLGAESGRVMHARLSQGRVLLTEIHRFTTAATEFAGRLRWNLQSISEAIVQGLRKAGQIAQEQNIQYSSISVDSWAVDYVLMREPEPLLMLPYCYRDARALSPFRTVRERLGDAFIYSETGIQFITLNTIYQLTADLEESPQLLQHSERFLLIADWLHWYLSGVAVQEESNASSTQLYNPAKRDWAWPLIRALGFPEHIFPKVVKPGTPIGVLRPILSAETGLPLVPVVAGCTHDTATAIASVPAERGSDWAYLSSGTWSLLGAELDTPILTEQARQANFTNEIGYGGTIRFLKNIIGLWILQECRRTWAKNGDELSYAEIVQQAAAATPHGPLIQPDDPRFFQPGEMPEKVRAYCVETGQQPPATVGEIARCVLESLAHLYRVRLEELAAVTARTFRVLHIVGGGAKNELLNQMTADATGLTVLAGPAEGTALGNALLQAVTLGHLSGLDELRAVVRASYDLQTYTPTAADAWSAAHERFKKLPTV